MILELLKVETTSSRKIRHYTSNEISAYIVKDRPTDRGGRTDEMLAPPLEHPKWQRGGGHGGGGRGHYQGGSRGHYEGGRGNYQRGGRGHYHEGDRGHGHRGGRGGGRGGFFQQFRNQRENLHENQVKIYIILNVKPFL